MEILDKNHNQVERFWNDYLNLNPLTKKVRKIDTESQHKTLIKLGGFFRSFNLLNKILDQHCYGVLNVSF